VRVVTPINLQANYTIFFRSGCKINPKFDYDNYGLVQEYISQFEPPDGEYFDLAKVILEKFKE